MAVETFGNSSTALPSAIHARDQVYCRFPGFVTGFEVFVNCQRLGFGLEFDFIPWFVAEAAPLRIPCLVIDASRVKDTRHGGVLLNRRTKIRVAIPSASN